ncbi:V-type ATPase subunit [Candidatus Bathyarchaeota archaeon]|nr:V-type ATPase subunit [Candidatus Bathyarchaeota archaeon]
MSAWKYKRITSKVIVAKMKLIDIKDLAGMVRGSFDQVHSMLMNTPYQQDISKIPPEQLSSGTLESVLSRNFARTFNEIMDSSPKDIRRLLSTVQMKFEANAVKAMLRAKKADLGVDDTMRYITPVGRIGEGECRELLSKSANTEDLIKALSDMYEYGAILKEKSTAYKETGDLLMLETALDKHAYYKIWKASGKLGGLDKRIARTVLEIEIDSINIRVILRCKALGISENQIKNYIIPVSEFFNEKVFEDSIKAVDIKSSIETMHVAARQRMAKDHRYMLNDILKEYEHSLSLSQLETVLDHSLLKTNLRMLKRYTPFFNIGLILAFLNLKWFEIRNLRTIIKGTESKISSSRIKRLLIIPD